MSVKIHPVIKTVKDNAINSMAATGDSILKRLNKEDGDKVIFSKKLDVAINKNTLIGASATLAAFILALGCVRGIVNKIKQIKNNDK